MHTHQFLVLAVCGPCLLAACTQVLGVGDAHLDPTFSDPAAVQAAAGSGGAKGAGATCRAFDNTRVTKLMPGGGLLPLPTAK